ncbi:conjugal transfer protein TraG, partial [Butyricicoccus sp. 1XD8-22]
MNTLLAKWKDSIVNWKTNADISKVPFSLVTILFVLGFYFWLRAWFHISALLYETFTGNEFNFILFGTNHTVSLLYVIVTAIVSIYTWLLSTRVSFYRTRRMRLVAFLYMATYVFGVIAWYGMSRIYLYLLPFLEKSLNNKIDGDIISGEFVLSLAISQKQELYFLLMTMPLIVVWFVSYFFLTKFHVYEHDIKDAFFEFEWNGRRLQKFAKLEGTDYFPDVELGADIKTNEMITLYGIDRTLNTNITGAIGTGKSAALALPTLNQDMHHMTKFINEFKELYGREDYVSEEVSGRYLNGISVIDPSNDLCKQVYQLAKAHNLPDEAITYIDPISVDTPSINPMRGPVDKVAEVFAQVIAGLSQSQGGNDFFQQAQRNHLKQYIYLLKEHDPSEDVTFDMLLDMYNNTQVTREMHVKLKNRFPENMSREVFNTRDVYNYWQILKGVDEWFDTTLIPKMDRSGDIAYDENGKILYVDAEAEYVKGLRNILNDMGANPLIRRVLFGKSDFD